MSEDLTAPADEAFLFPCPTCGHVFDALTAEWCSCVARRPSVVCANCQVCLCKSDPAVVRNFWQRAPASTHTSQERERELRILPSTVSANTIDVLVVDDDEEIRAAAAFMVGELGYSVLTASGAAEALQMMQTLTPTLVLTDALMPKVDGRELCRLIKGAYPEVKVVIMTALYTSPRFKHEALKIFRADDYLHKPIHFQQLSEVVTKLVTVREKREA